MSTVNITVNLYNGYCYHDSRHVDKLLCSRPTSALILLKFLIAGPKRFCYLASDKGVGTVCLQE